MKRPKFWSRCISHSGGDVAGFANAHFGEPHRKILLIAGAGFDPRAQAVAQTLVSCASHPLAAILVREERPGADPTLRTLADANTADLVSLIPAAKVEAVEIFAADGAAIGGRAIVSKLNSLVTLGDYTDVVVDFSALSIGIAYPITRLLIERLRASGPSDGGNPNIHVMVADSPDVDSAITSLSSDKIEPIHGFKGEFSLGGRTSSAKLWLPQLRPDKRPVLGRIHRFVDPADVCPVLPFPSRGPHSADKLIEQFREEFESTWGVDAHDIIYAHEKDPLDLYRAILDIDDARERVFRDVGGSLTILSPSGSKVLSVGALMAAIERNFPVIYCEALSYSLIGEQMTQHDSELMHVWLLGEAYAGLPRGNL